ACRSVCQGRSCSRPMLWDTTVCCAMRRSSRRSSISSAARPQVCPRSCRRCHAPRHSTERCAMAETPRQPIRARFYLEDLHVGQRFSSGVHAVDERQIKAFASAFDPQPFHLDDALARGSLFAGLAASGWHTAAITMRLLVDGGVPIAGGLIGAGAEIAWPNPARPGDMLRVESEVL